MIPSIHPFISPSVGPPIHLSTHHPPPTLPLPPIHHPPTIHHPSTCSQLRGTDSFSASLCLLEVGSTVHFASKIKLVHQVPGTQ